MEDLKYLIIVIGLGLASCNSMNKDFVQESTDSIQTAVVPFELLDNRMFVDVNINGQGPYKFVFDTGGGNCMTPEVASKLGLDVKPISNATGAGEQSVRAWNTRVNDFQVGRIRLAAQDFMVLDFSPIKRAFALPAFDGVFGFEFLQKYAAKINYPEKKISFFPLGSTSADGFTLIPFTLVADKPVISAKINNLDAKILIDTGDRSALTVFSNFRKHEKIEKAFKGLPLNITGYGIGGPIPAVVSKIEDFELIPGLKIKNVVARAPVTKGGFNAISGVNASIGNEILKQFDVMFDYQRKMMFLRANSSFGTNTQFVPVPVL